MKINVGFGLYVYVVEFKPFLGENIDDYINAFDNWYYEPDIVYGVNILKQKETLPYKYLDIQVVLDWMLETAPDCEAHIVEYRVPCEKKDKSLPIMYF